MFATWRRLRTYVFGAFGGGRDEGARGTGDPVVRLVPVEDCGGVAGFDYVGVD